MRLGHVCLLRTGAILWLIGMVPVALSLLLAVSPLRQGQLRRTAPGYQHVTCHDYSYRASRTTSTHYRPIEFRGVWYASRSSSIDEDFRAGMGYWMTKPSIERVPKTLQHTVGVFVPSNDSSQEQGQRQMLPQIIVNRRKWAMSLGGVWSASFLISSVFNTRSPRSSCSTSTSAMSTSTFRTVLFPAQASPAYADDVLTNALQSTTINTPAMKEFLDPRGFFSLRIPITHVPVRSRGGSGSSRSSTGRDDSDVGTIFTSGDMSKAEIIAIERFPIQLLLVENGIDPIGPLETFIDVGELIPVANLFLLRRERNKPPGTSNSQIILPSVYESKDGKELYFRFKTEIPVQNPELLREQYGISTLFRITTVKASLRSNDGNVHIVFASALEQDFNGLDGVALQEAVNSFQVMQRMS